MLISARLPKWQTFPRTGWLESFQKPAIGRPLEHCISSGSVWTNTNLWKLFSDFWISAVFGSRGWTSLNELRDNGLVGSGQEKFGLVVVARAPLRQGNEIALLLGCILAFVSPGSCVTLETWDPGASSSHAPNQCKRLQPKKNMTDWLHVVHYHMNAETHWTNDLDIWEKMQKMNAGEGVTPEEVLCNMSVTKLCSMVAQMRHCFCLKQILLAGCLPGWLACFSAACPPACPPACLLACVCVCVCVCVGVCVCVSTTCIGMHWSRQPDRRSPGGTLPSDAALALDLLCHTCPWLESHGLLFVHTKLLTALATHSFCPSSRPCGAHIFAATPEGLRLCPSHSSSRSRKLEHIAQLRGALSSHCFAIWRSSSDGLVEGLSL